MPRADLHSMRESRFGNIAHGLGSLIKLKVLSMEALLVSQLVVYRPSTNILILKSIYDK
jgi:hypothetical protein